MKLISFNLKVTISNNGYSRFETNYSQFENDYSQFYIGKCKIDMRSVGIEELWKMNLKNIIIKAALAVVYEIVQSTNKKPLLK